MKVFSKLGAAVMLAAASVMLAACATGLPTRVTRYSALSAPAGQTFYVVPAQEGAGGLEFGTYAAIITQQLEAQGYRYSGSPEQADMLVKVGYGVDEGTTEYVAERPFGPRYGWYRSGFYDPFYWGRPYWSAWGYDPFYYGWHDPFWYGGYGAFGPRIRSYKRYESYLDLNIVRRVDNASLFEGHVKGHSQTDELNRLVPNLIEAMFTGFPGRSGETVKITIPARKTS
ncbi:MAG TPA: DUF4136 domain-containing protein [Sphingomicrobium sp.]|nr:DUF4136 domain-containing protein [Sphingomicrobium sp.]